MPVQIPDDADFASFKEQCESHEGWIQRYNKAGVTVWCRDEETKTVQKLKASAAQGLLGNLHALHCGVTKPILEIPYILYTVLRKTLL